MTVPSMLRPATLADLDDAVSWIPTVRDSELWAGRRVPFPIDGTALPGAIDFSEANAFALCDGDRLVAFGQLMRKSSAGGHLARLIVSPLLRGRGYGEMLVRALLERARCESFEHVSLHVDRSNQPAVSLYLKLGLQDAPLPSDESESPGSRYMEKAV